MEEWETVDVPTHPQKDGNWVATVVEIRDNDTGIVREYQNADILTDGGAEPSSYIWEDGNYSCDCNRRLFFARAAGEDEDWDSDCSDGLYSVRVRNKKSGRVFYSEFDA
jgi:hypothetical protein